MKNPRITFTTSPNIVMLLDILLERGLYGSTRADVVATLVAAQVSRLVSVADVDRVTAAVAVERERERTEVACGVEPEGVWTLEGWDDDRQGLGKISVIKVVRAFTGLGLHEAKEWTELPKPIKLPDLSGGDTDLALRNHAFRDALIAAGAMLRMTPGRKP